MITGIFLNTLRPTHYTADLYIMQNKLGKYVTTDFEKIYIIVLVLVVVFLCVHLKKAVGKISLKEFEFD